MKEFFKDKSYGFFVTLALMTLSVATMIIYASVYGGTRFMSWAEFAVVVARRGIEYCAHCVQTIQMGACVIAYYEFFGVAVIYLLYLFSRFGRACRYSVGGVPSRIFRERGIFCAYSHSKRG